jgi:predicted N-formylglutamate amidohydrolase
MIPPFNILTFDEKRPIDVLRPNSKSRFFLTCDHASATIPSVLDNLGLSKDTLLHHIGWDIGALGVAKELSTILGATLIWQNYSRLVIDCNRMLKHPSLIPRTSETTEILGNLQITDKERHQRICEFYNPYHLQIKKLLDKRSKAGVETIFISIHSFTPIYLGIQRPWELGILHSDDAAYSHAILDFITRETNIKVGDNEPYKIEEKDCTIPSHAIARNLPNTLFEVRQDLIASDESQKFWGAKLAEILTATARYAV